MNKYKKAEPHLSLQLCRHSGFKCVHTYVYVHVVYPYANRYGRSRRAYLQVGYEVTIDALYPYIEACLGDLISLCTQQYSDYFGVVVYLCMVIKHTHYVKCALQLRSGQL